MKYRWAAVLERSGIDMVEDAEIETYQRVKKGGETVDNESGQNVVLGIIETTKKIGNLIHLEVMQVDV